MTFVYVLATDREEFYKEQLLLSIYSLRKHNNDARIILLVDQESFRKSKEDTLLKNYVDEIKIIDLPLGLSSTQKSRFIKTSIPDYIEEDFVYLDNDTVITDSLHELSNFKLDIGAVWNQHSDDWNFKRLHPMLKEYRAITGLKAYKDFSLSHSLFNGGILVCKKTKKTRSFFKKWHELWLYDSLSLGFNKDQVALWRTNLIFDELIVPIEGTYNCQLLYPKEAIKYLLNAKILHYFSSSARISHLKIKDTKFLEKIRKEGITEYIDNYMNNIINDYLSGIVLLIENDKGLYINLFQIMYRKIGRDFPFLKNIVRKFHINFLHS